MLRVQEALDLVDVAFSSPAARTKGPNRKPLQSLGNKQAPSVPAELHTKMTSIQQAARMSCSGKDSPYSSKLLKSMHQQPSPPKKLSFDERRALFESAIQAGDVVVVTPAAVAAKNRKLEAGQHPVTTNQSVVAESPGKPAEKTPALKRVKFVSESSSIEATSALNKSAEDDEKSIDDKIDHTDVKGESINVVHQVDGLATGTFSIAVDSDEKIDACQQPHKIEIVSSSSSDHSPEKIATAAQPHLTAVIPDTPSRKGLATAADSLTHSHAAIKTLSIDLISRLRNGASQSPNHAANRIRDLQKENIDLQTTCTDLRKSLKEADDSLADTASVLKIRENTIKILTDLVEDTDAECENLVNEMETMSEEKTTLILQLQAARNDARSHGREAQTLHEQLSNAIKTVDAVLSVLEKHYSVDHVVVEPAIDSPDKVAAVVETWCANFAALSIAPSTTDTAQSGW